MRRKAVIAFICLFAATAANGQDKVMAIVSRQKSVFTAPPVKTPNAAAVDGPLLGNGSFAAALGGTPDALCFYLARNDFWRLKNGFDASFPAPLGRLSIRFPALEKGTFLVEQDLWNATTSGDFSKGDARIQMTAWAAATKDRLIVTIKNTGKVSINGKIRLLAPEKADHPFKDSLATGTTHGMQWLSRSFTEDVDISSGASAAIRITGSAGEDVSLQPGRELTIICATSSVFQGRDAEGRMKEGLLATGPRALGQLHAAHLGWWHGFWRESHVSVGDSLIEAQYYRSQYNMASCSRDPRFPPGIFGSWVTREIPAWNGDYHLNYNYSAPFYALYASNHLRQARPYDAPLLDFMERGKYYASRIAGAQNAILYPVGIGPLGMETTRKNDIMQRKNADYISGGQVEDEGLFFGQKSNAAYCAVNLSFAFYATYDRQWAGKTYPFLRATAEFWRQYLQEENGTYNILNDAIHEGTIGSRNAILSLGLVKMVMGTAADMADFLGKDGDLAREWRRIREHVAPFPEQDMQGLRVFRYTEKGTAWWNDNTLGIQHIYPAGQIGLDSDTALLRVAHNTVRLLNRWTDFNGSNSFFPAAVRIGYPADTIWEKLQAYSLHTWPNGFQRNNPHGIENCSTVPNTVNEMLCMSHGKGIRVFANWPAARDAEFGDLRANGAFLVSSEKKNGKVRYVKLKSEQGRPLRLMNPWPGAAMKIRSDKKAVRTFSGQWLDIATSAGETIIITPAT
ncbi:glycosyl hydrolase family 95 catalytic domain-containing protein [Chitinophaga caseinilytica]|uniref:glycosyl hydrolase family 95 catalytic domain-containing protein n=1 Tax=Chitinophaga caseinilytica TaxID=2267521 RepID=UPI003C30E9CD